MTVDLAALAKLASEATPETAGRWRYRRSIFPDDAVNYAYVEWGKEGIYGTGTLSQPMARFIAAASPDVVAALVRLALAAKEYEATWTTAASHALIAALAELER
jgi:hypothetical protein